MGKLILSAVVAAGLTLAGCATYRAPTAGPVATVTLVNSGLTGRQNVKLLYRGEAFEQRADMNASMMFVYDQPWPLRAGSRQMLETETVTFASQYLETYCSAFFSFVPEAGHAYQVRPFARTAPATGCDVEVIDKATGAVPSSLRPETAPAA